jgi:hypothetical protein
MEYFVLSRNTKILADESCAPIRNAVEILKRDMAAGLRGEGPENRIRVELEAGMAAGLKNTIDEVKGYGSVPYKDTTEAYEYYRKLSE